MSSSTNLKQRIRSFEKRLQKEMLNIFCPVHLSLGHEDVAVDLNECMIKEDWLFATHRNHHHYLAKGGSEQLLWDEIMGLESGLNHGFAGSQAIVDPSINFHSSAILGGLIGVATGVGYALKVDNSNAVSICCIGDAATEQGVFWESLNFVALHQLPVVFICENNGMSVDSPIGERQAAAICPRVESFGVKTFTDVIEAVSYSRRSRMPSFCEVKVKLECAHINMATVLDGCDVGE